MTIAMIVNIVKLQSAAREEREANDILFGTATNEDGRPIDKDIGEEKMHKY